MMLGLPQLSHGGRQIGQAGDQASEPRVVRVHAPPGL